MKLLLKVGGAAIETDAGRRALAQSVRAARELCHQVMVVHGGGRQIAELTARLGLQERRHEGLRITDAATADAVLMVLGGSTNRQLVAAFEAEGVPAVGITGADGSSFAVRRSHADGVDLGYVGEVIRIRRGLIDTLVDNDYVPIIATVAPLADTEPGPRDRLYNINADLAAGPLAQALGADTLVFLTDVEGVRGADGRRIATLSAQVAHELRVAGVIAGGMIPKVDAALAAAQAAGATLVRIASFEAGLLAALEPGAGTTIAAAPMRDETGRARASRDAAS